MDMEYLLPAVFAAVVDETVAGFGHALFFGDLLRRAVDFSKQVPVVRSDVVHRRDMFFRNN